MKESQEPGSTSREENREQGSRSRDSMRPAPRSPLPAPFVAIACGGTGGHLFPGLAVAEELVGRGCGVGLLISPKEVDRRAVKTARGVEGHTPPAVGFQRDRKSGVEGKRGDLGG